jgi:hypothetical protein
MIIKRITILLTLFIFCTVIQVWADTTGTLNGTFYGGSIIKMNKLEEKHQPGISYKDDGEVPEDAFEDAFLESPKANKRLKLIESIEKIFSIYKFGETTWRYKFLDPQGVKETKSLNSEYGQSILKLHSNVNRYLEEGVAQVTFELFQSKLKRTEIFILFHLSFDLKGEQMFLEMHLTPSSGKGVNFFIPF